MRLSRSSETVPSSRRTKPVLLLIGHAGIPTGFARVLQAIAARLADAFDVHWLGINLPNIVSPSAAYTLHPNLGSLHSAETLITLVREIRPDACLVLDEPWVCAQRIATLRAMVPSPRVLCYCAADEAQSLPANLLPTLALADHLIVFTAAAGQLLSQSFAESSISTPPVTIIPHGVDIDVFHPVSKLESRRAVFPQERGNDGGFLVLNANRNQPFKRIDLTLEGFAIFARDKPSNVKLCLHMASRPAALEETPLADRLGIRDRMVFTNSPGPSHPHFDDDSLNLLYNACDIGINTSDREGWGLVSFEHAATGAPQIVSHLPALYELWQEAAILLPTQPALSNQVLGRISPTVDPRDVARVLDRLYGDQHARERYGNAALQNARAAKYRWDHIAAQWTRLMEETLYA